MEAIKVHPFVEQHAAMAYEAPKHPWRAHSLRRLPWDALVAALVGVGCAFFTFAVIMTSDGDLIETWKVTPGVYLAIGSVVANVALRYAFSKGVERSWWAAATREDRGATVSELHRIWAFGTSLRSTLLAGRHFNLVALAALLLALVPASAPLAQRASRTATRGVFADVDVPVVAARSVTARMATGMATGRSGLVGYLTPGFTTVLQDHVLSRPIPVPDSPCRGTCRGVVQAVGYEISCVNGTALVDKSRSSFGDPDGESVLDNGVVFGTAFQYSESGGSSGGNWTLGEPVINMTARWKEEGKCKADVMVRNCTLVPATMEYRVVFTNATVALDDGYTYADDKRINYLETGAQQFIGPSIHGGLWLALDRMFNSVVTLSFAGARGYDMTTEGLTSLRYNRVVDEGDDIECSHTWLDPTPDLLAAARQLIFRHAVQGVEEDEPDTAAVAPQSVLATQEGVEVVYQSDMLFLALALTPVGLSAVSVLPLLLWWWRLGRSMTLSPVEVARAFGAPVLAEAGSNSDARGLMKEVGKKEVRYGVIVSSGGEECLGFAGPGEVQTPRSGSMY